MSRTCTVMRSLGVLSVTSVLCLGCSSCTQGLFFASCKEAHQIDSVKLKGIEKASVLYVERVLSEDWELAYNQLTDEAQQQTARENFAEWRKSFVAFAPFKNLRVSEVYVPHVTGWAAPRVVCGTLSQGNWVSVVTMRGQESVHTLVEADATNNQWTFALTLTQKSGQWRIHYSHGGASSLGPKDSTDLWKMASREHDQGRDFNALTLYAAGRDLADRGPNLELGVRSEILKEMSRIPGPPEFRGSPPYFLQGDTRQFRIHRFGPLAVGGKIYLDLTHEVKILENEKEMEKMNQDLIAVMGLRFPEYRHVYAGITATAQELGGNRVFRSVKELEPSSSTKRE